MMPRHSFPPALMKLLFFVGIPWMLLDAGEHVLFPNIDNLVVEAGALGEERGELVLALV